MKDEIRNKINKSGEGMRSDLLIVILFLILAGIFGALHFIVCAFDAELVIGLFKNQLPY